MWVYHNSDASSATVPAFPFQEEIMRRIPARFFVGVLLIVVNLAAQEVSSSITGRITDPAGLSIQGATITATDRQRATRWSAETNGDGFYAFPRIPGGLYDLQVEAKGF